jgi:hypothetical protein
LITDISDVKKDGEQTIWSVAPESRIQEPEDNLEDKVVQVM